MIAYILYLPLKSVRKQLKLVVFLEKKLLWNKIYIVLILGSAIKNMGLFSKIPIDFKIETRDL